MLYKNILTFYRSQIKAQMKRKAFDDAGLPQPTEPSPKKQAIQVESQPKPVAVVATSAVTTSAGMEPQQKKQKQNGLFTFQVQILCRLRSIVAHRDHFVWRLSVPPFVCPCVCLSDSHSLLVVRHSYVSQATHAFLRMLPLCCCNFGRIYYLN